VGVNLGENGVGFQSKCEHFGRVPGWFWEIFAMKKVESRDGLRKLRVSDFKNS
jgi:hypothetical protein